MFLRLQTKTIGGKGGKMALLVKKVADPCTRALHSKNAGLLVVPRVSKSTMGARAFSYQAPLLWNQLPVCVRVADSLSVFKSALKTFLFDKAYS